MRYFTLACVLGCEFVGVTDEDGGGGGGRWGVFMA